MSRISVHNEWDPLEEIIVGRAQNAQVPRPDPGIFAVDYLHCGKLENIPSGRYDARVIDETEEDLDLLVSALGKCGVVVQRPAVADHGVAFKTPHWESDGQYNYCPRDLLLAVGNTLIETPMVFRARFFESLSYKDLLLEYFKSGARWISAPKPRLLASTYLPSRPPGTPAITNDEPLFDAANVLRMGKDLLYLVSDSGNRLGARWLQDAVGEQYRVHVLDNLYSGVHLDSTILLVRPGLVFLNADRVSPRNLPAVFKNWEVVYFSDIVDSGTPDSGALSSKWIGMNILMINPRLAVVDRAQVPLIRALERHGVDVIPLVLRHGRTLGGGFHCVTLDVRRKGPLQDYLEP
jgi:N-dimethylarginine dimethylaminohydrolase